MLESNASASHGIKDLLKQVDILNISQEVADVIVKLGILVDQVCADILHKQAVSNEIEKKQETQATK